MNQNNWWTETDVNEISAKQQENLLVKLINLELMQIFGYLQNSGRRW